MKTCFKCGQSKDLSEFYPHPQMGDGHLNKCKECNKRDVQENYQKRRRQYQEYEHRRALEPARKKQQVQNLKALRQRNPMKAKAWRDVGRAIRTGRLRRGPCEVCGSQIVQAHHDDYGKPLDVKWLCFKHHRELKHGQQVYLEAS